MKKIATFITLIFMINCVNAQKINASKVPEAVKNSFTKMHPSITTIKWETEDANYEANYKESGKDISDIFLPDGTFLESEIDIDASQLPATVLNYVKEHYPSKKISEAAKITKADGSVNWEAEVKNMDVLFDADGKFIKEIKE